MSNKQKLTDSEEVIWQLFLNGPTWDGWILSKAGRNELLDSGFALREDGWSFLTVDGIKRALVLGFDRLKGM